MGLPAKANIEAVPNFLANLEATHQFFALQDAETADSRPALLKTRLRDRVAILSWSSASRYSTRFLAAKSAQARLKTNALLQLAHQAGLPDLREYVLGRHIMLYAHSETEVVLLAPKHQRQLLYAVA